MCLHSLTRLIIGHVHVLTCMCPHQQLHVLTHMQHDTLSSRIVVPLAEELPSSRVPKPDFSRVRPVSVSWCFGRPSCCGRRPGAPAAPWRDILIYRRNNGPFTALFGNHTRGRGLFFPFWCFQQFLSTHNPPLEPRVRPHRVFHRGAASVRCLAIRIGNSLLSELSGADASTWPYEMMRRSAFSLCVIFLCVFTRMKICVYTHSHV